MKKRLTSLLLACAMALCLMPTAAMAAGTGKAIQLGASGIKDPSATMGDKGTYQTPNSYIYFGVNGDSSAPIKWRVLDADKANDNSIAGIFLLSEHLLASGIQFDKDNTANSGQINLNEWQHSDAQKWCIEFASATSNFSVTEQKAMLGVVKTDSSGQLYNNNWGTSSLTDSDKMFFLSARELSDYVGSYRSAPGLKATFADSPDAGVWWLRSPVALSAYGAGVVYEDGRVGDRQANNARAARPAFNLNPDSVLFTAAAAGGKGSTVGSLVEVQDYTGSEWKLTLHDASRDAFAVTEDTAVGKQGDTITLNYRNATVGTNEYISAIIEDGSGALYYGRLKSTADSADAGGTVELKIPSGLAPGSYTLKLFSEQYNGGENDDTKLTDYASAFAAVTLTVFAPVTDINMANASAVQVDTDLALAATVVPNDATNKDITWSVEEPNDTGASITGSTFRATTPGSAKIKATIANGKAVGMDYTKTFEITVNEKPTVDKPVIDPNGGSSGSNAGGGYIAPAQNSAQNAGADTRISGVNIPSGDMLITTPTQNSSFMRLLGGNTLVGMWDIKLQSGKTSIQGSTLSFNVGKGNAGKVYTLYHLKADGMTESFTATADAQGIVSFYPIHELSPFMLVQGGGITTTSIVSVPATGGMGAGLGLLLLSAMMAAAVLMKRRKAQV